MRKSDYQEKSNQRAFAIFCVLILLVMAITCRSQTKPMKYSCGKFDTLYVGIEDSINPHLTVKCSRHTHTQMTSVTIGFTNGNMVTYYADEGYRISDLELLRTTEFDYISFDEKYFSTACTEIRTKDYFIKCLNIVEK